MEKLKEYYVKFADFMEKAGVKLTLGLLIYTILLCVIAVNLDRLYIRHKFQSALSEAFKQTGSIFGANESTKEKPKRKKLFTPKPKELTTGETIKTQTMEITIQKAGFINKLIPPRIREWSYYTYYEAKDKENTLIDMVINVKNLDTTEISTENILQEVKALYDTKYEYSGDSVVEHADGSDFDTSSTINPLQTRKIHVLIEVPKIAKSDNAPVDIVFDVDNQTYTLPIKSLKIEENEQTTSQIQAQQVHEVKKEEPKKEIVQVAPKQQTKPSTKPQNKVVKQYPKQNITPKVLEPVKSNRDIAKDMLFN